MEKKEIRVFFLPVALITGLLVGLMLINNAKAQSLRAEIEREQFRIEEEHPDDVWSASGDNTHGIPTYEVVIENGPVSVYLNTYVIGGLSGEIRVYVKVARKCRYMNEDGEARVAIISKEEAGYYTCNSEDYTDSIESIIGAVKLASEEYPSWAVVERRLPPSERSEKSTFAMRLWEEYIYPAATSEYDR